MTSSEDQRRSTSMRTIEPAATGSPDPIGAGAVPSLRRRLLVPTLVLSGSLMAVASSLGAPLIPTLSRADGVSLSTGEWLPALSLLTRVAARRAVGKHRGGPPLHHPVARAPANAGDGAAGLRAPPAGGHPRRPRRGRRGLCALSGIQRLHRADHPLGSASGW